MTVVCKMGCTATLGKGTKTTIQASEQNMKLGATKLKLQCILT